MAAPSRCFIKASLLAASQVMACGGDAPPATLLDRSDGAVAEAMDAAVVPDEDGRTEDTRRFDERDAVTDVAIDVRADTTADIPDSTSDASSAPDDGGSAFPWDLPPGFPIPIVPADNPMTREKVELGRHLFYDTRLSGNQTYSCATCHEQARAFTDGRAIAVGSTGQSHLRSSMSLANVAYGPTFAWANPVLTKLEDQIPVPMFGVEPIVELGLRGLEAEMLGRLRAEPRYTTLFAAGFADDVDPISTANVVRAIASFERTLLSGNSPFDRWRNGDDFALSDAAQRGRTLFFGEKADCFHCHNGFNLSDAVTFEGKPLAGAVFHNTGLYNIDGQGGYPPGNTGLYEFTRLDRDMGRFKTPTLRNVAVTAPYMHDGSAATLADVVDHYIAGGRTITSGPYAGNGSTNPYKDGRIAGLSLINDEKADLIAFLESLTDESFLHDPRFSNPWASTGMTAGGQDASPDR